MKTVKPWFVATNVCGKSAKRCRGEGDTPAAAARLCLADMQAGGSRSKEMTVTECLHETDENGRGWITYVIGAGPGQRRMGYWRGPATAGFVAGLEQNAMIDA